MAGKLRLANVEHRGDNRQTPQQSTVKSAVGRRKGNTMPRGKSKAEKAIDLFGMFSAPVTEIDVDDDNIIENSVAKIAPEIIDFVRTAFAPWIEKALDLATQGIGDKIVRIPRCVPTVTTILDDEGNPTDQSVTAEELAAKFQVALRASATEAELAPIAKMVKRGDNIGKQAVDSHNRPVFQGGSWVVRTGPATPKDAGYNGGTDQSVFKVKLSLRVLDSADATTTAVETIARQTERAETSKAAAKSNAGKASSARKAS